MEWYEIENIQEFDSPALVIHPDRIKRNIQYAIRQVGNPDRLRPHVKTHKMAKVAKLQLEAGITKFKCATIAEAEMLAEAGAKDILIAYQILGPKLHRLIHLTERFPDVSFASLVDNLTTLHEIQDTFGDSKKMAKLYIDLDVGQHRTGVAPGPIAKEIVENSCDLSHLKIVGLHVYDGHIRDDDFSTRKQRIDEAFMPVLDLATYFERKLGHQPEIIAGGSPTFFVHALRENVICSPGTFVFWDVGYNDMLPESKFQWAAVLVTRVISKMTPTRICVDLGHKSVAAENPFPRVHILNLPDAKQVGQSEEHLVLELTNNSEVEVGDVLYGIPIHICPTVALYNSVYVAKDNKIQGEWKVTARGRKLTV